MISAKWKIAQFLEIRWWQSYLKNKDATAYLRVKSAYWQRLLAQVDLKIEAGTRVLDAGCGPAGIFMLLKHCEVKAIDPLLTDYINKISHFDPTDYPWVAFQGMMLEQLKAPYQFDYCFCMNAINHVSDLNKAIKALTRSVKKGGYLILSVDAHHNKLLKKIFQLFPGDLLHPHQLGIQEYKNRIQEEGGQLQQEILLKKGAIFNYYLLVFQL